MGHKRFGKNGHSGFGGHGSHGGGGKHGHGSRGGHGSGGSHGGGLSKLFGSGHGKKSGFSLRNLLSRLFR